MGGIQCAYFSSRASRGRSPTPTSPVFWGKLKVNSWRIYVLGFRVKGLGYLSSILGEPKVNFGNILGLCKGVCSTPDI